VQLLLAEMGRVIFNDQYIAMGERKYPLNISQLSPSIHFVVVNAGEKVYREMFIKY